MRALPFLAMVLLVALSGTAQAGSVEMNYPSSVPGVTFRKSFSTAIHESSTTEVVVTLTTPSVDVPQELAKYIGYVRKAGGEVVARRRTAGMDWSGAFDFFRSIVSDLIEYVETSVYLDSLDEYNVVMIFEQNETKKNPEYQQFIFVRKSQAALWAERKGDGKVVQ